MYLAWMTLFGISSLTARYYKETLGLNPEARNGCLGIGYWIWVNSSINEWLAIIGRSSYLVIFPRSTISSLCFLSCWCGSGCWALSTFEERMFPATLTTSTSPIQRISCGTAGIIIKWFGFTESQASWLQFFFILLFLWLGDDQWGLWDLREFGLIWEKSGFGVMCYWLIWQSSHAVSSFYNFSFSAGFNVSLLAGW